MRIWDIPCSRLCRQHLLGEHRELHALHAIILNGKAGYRRHPERLRWEGCLPALRSRHVEQINEMEARGYKHQSPLEGPAFGAPPNPWEPVENQITRLRSKGCGCKV
jgi:hypothetical protein